MPLPYADDVTLIQPIRTFQSLLFLQNDLNKIVSWFDRNRVPLNLSRCTTMICSARRPANLDIPQLKIRDVPLTQVAKIKLLGVTIDHRLTFSVHTDATIARARRVLALPQRATFGAGPDALRALFIYHSCFPSWISVPLCGCRTRPPVLHASQAYRDAQPLPCSGDHPGLTALTLNTAQRIYFEPSAGSPLSRGTTLHRSGCF